MIATAATQMPDWKTISVSLPASNAPRVVLTLDSGDGGQPQKRATLTLDRRTGETVRWEPFSSQSSGRKARTWLRFAHTGEVYGLVGQTLAGSRHCRRRRSRVDRVWRSRCAALPGGANDPPTLCRKLRDVSAGRAVSPI